VGKNGGQILQLAEIKYGGEHKSNNGGFRMGIKKLPPLLGAVLKNHIETILSTTVFR